jgi:hypothetical protein
MKRTPMGPPPLRLVCSAPPNSAPDLAARLRRLRAKFDETPKGPPLFEVCTLAAGVLYFNDSAEDFLEAIEIADALAADAPAELRDAIKYAKENIVTGRTFAAMAHAIEAATLVYHTDALRLHERWLALGRPQLQRQAVRYVPGRTPHGGHTPNQKRST